MENPFAAPSCCASIPLTKNARRRRKKKQPPQPPQPPQQSQQSQPPQHSTSSTHVPSVGEIRLDVASDVYKSFSNVFSRYQPDTLSLQQSSASSKGEVIYSDDDDDDADSQPDLDHEVGGLSRLSKRRQRKLQRLSVAELKQLVRKPEVVEWTDVTANDPRLLVHLKCLRNSIPIPPHWAQKRDYLQNKRGIEKQPYQLPTYIVDTGMLTMKDALKQNEAEQTLKQKTRERVQPKMGKMEIDYQKLYDAFFKFQSKPCLSSYGDIYYEGKEYDTKYMDKRPAQLSTQLIDALCIPPLAPPPWLIAMQRFGPPPSYPHLHIPGLNAPIPHGAQWGFHPGGWGRPPVDEYGNPLYPNVLPTTVHHVDPELVDNVETQHWGALQPEESDPEDDDNHDDNHDGEPQDHDQHQASTQAQASHDVDQSGLQSVSSVGIGLQTPSFLQLRKQTRIECDSAPRSLYQVVPERAVVASSGELLASDRMYDLSSIQHAHASGHASGHASVRVLGADERRIKRACDAVDVCLNPDSLQTDMHDTHNLAQRYHQQTSVNATTRFGYANHDQHAVAEVREHMESERTNQQQRSASSKR